MNKITSEDYIDLIVENEILPLYVDDMMNATTYLNAKHSILHIPNENFDMCSLGTYPYHFIPSCFTLASDINIDASGISKIQRHPNFQLYGQGVLIGIIDTGIEYENKAFQHTDGTSKIISIWDQTMNDGTSIPDGFTYGTEYNTALINEALKSPSPRSIVPTTDTIGHGTMISGIIAGSPNTDNQFSGVVPYAEIIAVKLKEAKKITKQLFAIPDNSLCFQETDILQGIRYLMSVSDRLNRPLAICFALGTNQGGHDGHGAVSSYLSLISQTARHCVISAAGNEGNSGRHYQGLLVKDIPFHDFQLNVGKNEVSFSMEVWQNTPYRIAIDITTPTGEYITPIYPQLSSCREFGFVFESTKLWVNNEIIEGETGDQLVLFRFQSPTSGIWKFRVYNIDNFSSEYNVWLPSDGLLTNDTYFIESDPDTTIISPANADHIISVTAYDVATGGIGIMSSRGYTRSNVIKPDIAAPGINILAPALGNNYSYMSGTGAAAAHVTGIVAMLLEWGIVRDNLKSMNGQDIRQLLIRGAKRSSSLEYPNRIWGYGTVDIYNTFEQLR